MLLLEVKLPSTESASPAESILHAVQIEEGSFDSVQYLSRNSRLKVDVVALYRLGVMKQHHIGL